MKLLPILLCNVVLVVGGILVYDQLRSDGSSASFELGADTLDARAFERRLAALEQQRAPALRAVGAEPRLLERVGELEAALAALGVPRDAAPAPSDGDGPRPADEDALAAPDAKAGGPKAKRKPTKDEIDRFRTLQAAVREWEHANRNHIRVDKALVGLDVRLNEKQREKLVEAYVAFAPRRSAIWAEAKRSGMMSGPNADWQTIVREVTGTITREFSEQISGFVPGRDAERISGALYGQSK